MSYKIKKIKERYFYAFIFFIVILYFWQFFTKFFHIPEYILPAPSQIAVSFQKSSGIFLKHTLVTSGEIISGFIIGATLGVVLAIFISASKILLKTIYPLIISVQSLPKLALAPLFVIWFGFGVLPKIIITALVVFFPVMINTIKGLFSVSSDLLDFMKSLRASKSQILFKIQIPFSLPYLFTGLKISSTLAVVGAIIGEFVGADKGLGYLIMISSTNLNTSYMFVALILLAVIGLLLFGLIGLLERVILPWHIIDNE